MRRPTSIRLTAFLFTAASIVIALTVSFAWSVSAADPCAIPSFTAPTPYSQPAPRAIVVADFNKDGKLDFAAANNRVAGTITVRMGDGTGEFSEPFPFQGGRNPTFLATGDLNGDGNADLVTANESNASGVFTVLLGNGLGGFGGPIAIFHTPGGPNITTSVAIADVNGDGKADLIATSATFNGVRVFFGDGTGSISSSLGVASGGFSPRHLVMTDLNADGKLDVVVANQFSDIPDQGNVATLLGDGAGNFNAARTFRVGGTPTSLTVGDFNGDSKPDVASVHPGSAVSVLLGDGTGNLGTPNNYSSGGINPQSIVNGDFNSDGKIDLAVFNSRPGNAAILAGDGMGGFSAVANFDVGTLALSTTPVAGVAVGADFNGDGRLDLAATNELPGTVVVLLNACGTPAPNRIQFSVNAFSGSESSGFGSSGLATAFVKRTGDVTGVAGVNYATVNGSAIAPSDYTSAAGTLTFGPGETFKTITFPLVDDNLDEPVEQFTTILSNATGTGTLGTILSTTILVLDDDPLPVISINDATVVEGNSGTKNLNFVVSLSNPSGSPVTLNYSTADGSAVAEADYQMVNNTISLNPGEFIKHVTIPIKGDTLPEVNETLFVNLSNPTNAVLSDSQGLGTIADDDSACPAPSFGTPTEVSVGTNPIELVAGDFNADGRRDLAVANTGSDNVSILLGTGDGGLGAATNFAVGDHPQNIAASDVNLDGKLDLVTANRDSASVSILLNSGLAVFAASTISPLPNLTGLAISDFNGDTKPDLALVSTGPGIGPSIVSILVGDGTGAFGAQTSYATGTTSRFIVAADFNGDGKPDLATANFQGSSLSILLNNGNGTFASATSVVVAGSPVSLAAGDLNSDGKLDLVVSKPDGLSILHGNGTGGFVPGTNQTLGSNLSGVVALDLNGDGILDVAVADAGSGGSPTGGVWVLFGNGSGNFTSPAKYLIGFSNTAVAAADFNNDGKIDLASTTLNSPNKILVALNTCSSVVPTPSPSPSPTQYSVTGLVTENGSPLSNVTISLEMQFQGTPSTKVITTDAMGIYNSGELGCQTNVAVTPSKTGYSFSPLKIILVSNPQCLSGTGNANFIASLTPNVTELSAPNYAIGEAAGKAQIVVTRTDTTGSATVDYATGDFAGLNECNVVSGLGSSRCDYATSIGTLRFAAGETSKTIFIPLVDDGYVDGNETFTITLSNPTGMSLGTNRTATVTIQDNDATTGANPIDGIDFFIRQQYIDFLGRETDPGGLTGWRNILNSCGTTVQEPCDRIEVSAGFFRSEEFQSRGYFIYRFFSALGRIPLYSEFANDLAKVSGFLTAEQLEAGKAAFVTEFMARPEFQTRYSATFSNPTAYVDALLATVGLPGHPARNGWISMLNATNTTQTRGQVLRQLVESVEVYNKYYNEAFVIMQYFGYLRRTADALYLDWLQIMNTTSGDYRIMVNGFINSAEYRRRFGP